MKQTNNAIKFLMAQYRAIFKQAYIKGLVSAVVLTTGLAVAGSANAEGELNNAAVGNSGLASEGKFILVDGESTAVGDGDGSTADKAKKYKFIQLTGVASAGPTDWNANVTITGGKADGTENKLTIDESTGGALNLTGSGSLTIKTSDAANGLAIKGSGSHAITLGIKDINIESGALNVTSADAKIDVKADTITIGQPSASTSEGASLLGGTASVNAAVKLVGDSNSNKEAILGDLTKSKITLQNNGKLELAATTTDAAGAVVNANELIAKGGSIVTSDKGGTINIANAGKFEGTTFTTATSTKLNVNAGSIRLTDSILKNAGTLTFVAKGTDGITVTGNTQLSGSTNFTDSKVSIADATFTAAGGAAGIAIVGEKAAATLTIDPASTDSLLKVGYLNLSGAGADKTATATVEGDLTLTQIKNAGTAAGDVGVGAHSSLNVTGKLTVTGNAAAGAAATSKVKADTLVVGGATLALGSGDFTFNNIDASEVTNVLTAGDNSALKITGSADSSAPSKLGASLAVEKGNVTVTGNVTAVADTSVQLTGSGTLSVGDNSRTVLDLSKAKFTSSATKTKETTVSVNADATLKVKAEELGTILAVDTASANGGIKLSVTDKATVEAVGNLELSKAFAVNENTAGIHIAKGGTLNVTGKLTTALTTTENLKGKVSASDVEFTGATASITSGEIEVRNSLSAPKATDKNIEVNKGTLTLASDSSGKINTGIKITSGTVNVIGEWSAGANAINVAGGTLTIGQVADEPGVSSASLTVDRLSAEAGTVNVTNGSLKTKEFDNTKTDESGAKELGATVTIAKDGSVTTDKFTTRDGITVSGQLTVNGVNTKLPVVPDLSAYVEEESFEFGKDGHRGIYATGAKTTIAGGTLTFTGNALSGMFNKAWKPEQKEKGDLVADNYGTYTLSNNGVLKLDFTDSTQGITLAELRQIKNELFGVSDGKVTGGSLDLGKAYIEGVSEVIKDGKISFDDYNQVIAGNNLENVAYDQIKKTVVTDVNGAFGGNIGAVQTVNGQLIVNADSNLWNASVNGGNFVSDSKGKVQGANIASGTNLALYGNGKIGDVTLTAGTEENVTTLAVKTESGAAKVELGSVGGVDENNNVIANTRFDVNKDVTAVVNGNVNVSDLVLSGNLTASKADKTSEINANKLTSLEGSVLTADKLNLGKLGANADTPDTVAVVDALGNIAVNKDMTVVAAAKDDVDGYSAKFGGTVEVKGALTSKNAFFGKNVSTGAALNASGSEFAGDVKVGKDLISTESRFAGGVAVENELKASNSQFLKDVSAKTVIVGASKDIGSDSTEGWAPTLFGGALKADKITVSAGQDSASGKTIRAELLAAGKVNAKTVELGNADLSVFGGSAEIDTLISRNGDGDLAVGNVGVEDFADTADFDEGKNYTGLAVVNNAENVSLYAHTGYDLASATILVKHLGGKGGKDEVLAGEVAVGQNGVIGLSTDADTLNRVVAAFRDGDRFAQFESDQDGTSALIYAHKNLKVTKNGSLVLTSGSLDDDVNTSLNKFYSNELTRGAQGYFGANTVLVLNSESFRKDAAGKTQAYITFETESGAAKLVADGGEISIIGNSMRDEYQIFSAVKAPAQNDKAVTYGLTDGSNGAGGDTGDKPNDTPAVGSISIVDLDGKDASITVTSANGLLTGELTSKNNGFVEMNVDEDVAPSVITGVSHPVYDTVLAYARGYNGEYVKNPAMPDDAEAAAEGDAEAPVVPDWLYSYDKNGNKVYEYNNELLTRVIFAGASASDVERVARLGVYGGAAHAALTANTTTFDAVSGRMGVGASQGNLTFADNGQGAGMWLAPVYRNHDSDGFAAQGLSYGVDMDLSGVALGGDFTTAGGLRLGAALNVGSGDAKGQGAATGVKNDFDYYGFAVYGGYTAGNLSVVADVTYTKADNDVETDTIVGKVGGSIDSTAISVGVTGQYTIAMNGFDLAPHAGLRYTNLKLDDYQADLNGAELVGFEGDTLNVFSIPVGFSVSKNIVSGAWTIKPAFDLTLTANFGDDELDGKTGWAGVENLDTKTTTEILDSFTYGATLGVSAKTGNFSFGFGLNYTGASNADEYGVNANARFVF